MQLKKSKSIRQKLALATSTLLVAAPVHSNAAEATQAEKTDIDISGLYYSETDEVSERVTVNKTQAVITNQLSEESKVKIGFIYDTMSGATPNGRIAHDGRIFVGSNNQGGGVTVTTASGFSFNTANSSGSSDVQIVPWKTDFSDNRLAGNFDWEYALNNTMKSTVGFGASFENDYDSYAASGKVDWDINQRRTTLSAGLSYNNDTVKPANGIPEGLGVLNCASDVIDLEWLKCGEKALFYKPAEKIVLNYFLGITQVWNRRTLVQANYSLGDESGYLTDPYKQLSVLLPDDVGGEEVAILYERRPDERETQSLYFKIVHLPTDKHTAYLSYRYFWDNWDITAHTADARFRLDINPKSYLQPHFRVSYQTAAFFADQKIQVGDSKYAEKPDYFSADHRVNEQGTVTAGLKYGRKLGKTGDFGVRVEQMRQYYKGNLLPDMKAWIVQVLLSMRY